MNLAEARRLGLKHRPRKRVGRGLGSGHGKTAGRGHKGAKSRSGWSRRIGYEGGQMPLFRRLPKRGFNNKNFKQFFTVVNVGVLEAFAAGAVVDLEAVLAAGLASRNRRGRLFKVLGGGELGKKLTVRADAVTAAARSKIEGAGGAVELQPKVVHRSKFVKKGERGVADAARRTTRRPAPPANP